MQDFIGQPIIVGSWLACGGLGNTSCEYGMILHRVDAVEVEKDNLKLTRLRVRYPDHKNAQAKASKVTARNSRKYVVITPPLEAIQLFVRIEQGTASPADHGQAGLWLHGKKDVWS